MSIINIKYSAAILTFIMTIKEIERAWLYRYVS